MPILLWILGNWRIFAILGAVIALWGFGFKTGYDQRAKHVPAELAAQQKADTKQCTKDKQITTEVGNDDQKRVDALNAELVRIKLRYASAPAHCTPVHTPGGIEAGSPGELRSADGKTFGVSTNALLDYAGDAERMRLQVIACQDFVQRVWAAKSASTNR